MDRRTIYSGQLPNVLDVLQAQQYAMIGVGKIAETVLGTPTLVDGFTCTPTTPASLNVLLNPGQVYQLENLEATSWSSVPADTAHSIVKQGILLDPLTFGITPPGTTGFSQVFLIEVQYADSDTGSTVLPYYNASNTSSPYSGPGNAGTAQNTLRKGMVAAQVKAGTAAATGTQVAPTADAGWTGLFLVTVANGASTITSGNIVQLPTAPFLQSNGKLPEIPTGVQTQSWVYAQDTSTSIGAVTIATSPAPASYTAGMAFEVKMANACGGATTINVNGLGNKAIVKIPGSVALAGGEWVAGDIIRIRYDGTNFQASGLSVRPPLLSNTTIYVNGSTGSDTTLDGSAATISGTHGPYKTIGRAMQYAANYGPSPNTLTIQIADGTYNEAVATPSYAITNLVINGNVSTPSNVLVTGAANQHTFLVNGPNTVTVRNLKVTASNTGTSNCGFIAGAAATLNVNNTVSGACNYAVFEAYGIAVLNCGNHTFLGNCTYAFNAINGGFIPLSTTLGNFTIGASITVTQFASATTAGNIGMTAGFQPTFTGAGSVTGQQYEASLNGVINTAGAGTGYFPGTVAGSTSTGGQYA